ncbi:hypothetical protein [Thiocapsa sp.]|uniref:hypothetical protein n=1 Tax=Thiocapsa sp. TaxID=2024551 RepID=UPI0025CF7F0F|nr:hypothetical protein [Thiocapsa sp.]
MPSRAPATASSPESVEITKLSLWLKTARRDKPLNNLDANIRCSNSLVESPGAAADTPADQALVDAFAALPPDRCAFDWRAAFPTELSLEHYVHEHAYPVPWSRYDAGPWSLGSPEVETLMGRLRERGVPLAEFVGCKPMLRCLRCAEDHPHRHLTPAAIGELTDTHARYASPMQQGAAEIRALERRLFDLVNQAYRLSEEDIALIRRTAPPRMPGD